MNKSKGLVRINEREGEQGPGWAGSLLASPQLFWSTSKKSCYCIPRFKKRGGFGGIQSCLKVLRHYESQERRGAEAVTHSYLAFGLKKIRSQLSVIPCWKVSAYFCISTPAS